MATPVQQKKSFDVTDKLMEEGGGQQYTNSLRLSFQYLWLAAALDWLISSVLKQKQLKSGRYKMEGVI